MHVYYLSLQELVHRKIKALKNSTRFQDGYTRERINQSEGEGSLSLISLIVHNVTNTRRSQTHPLIIFPNYMGVQH